MRKEKLERYQAAVKEQRDFLNNTVPERVKADSNFDFKSDEAYQKREKDINELYMWLEADKSLENRERAFDTQVQTRENGRSDTRKAESDKETEIREFADYLRSGDRQAIQKRAALASNGTTTGGYLVPTFVSDAVLVDLNAQETVRRAGAQVIPVDGNTNIPIFQDALANFIQEANAITDTDPTTAQVTIRPNLLVAETTYSWQLLNRGVGNLVDQIRQSFVRGIAKREANKFLVGTGTNEPQGLVAGGSTAQTTASPTAITASEIMDVWYALDPQYQQNATWIVNPTAASLIRALESTNGAPLWTANLKDGSDTLFGRPVILDANMPAPTAGLKPLVLADVFSAYIIGEETSLSVLSDPYTQANTGQSKIFVYKFVDGRVKTSAAAKVLLMHA